MRIADLGRECRKNATICLNMIVKNEAPVIGRCLASVASFIDRWVIVDTGSTDGTRQCVRECLRHLPGELHERPWLNFAHNRNEALALARPTAEYIFFIDADETLETDGRFDRSDCTADGYELTCCYERTSYRRCALVASRLQWRWVGVVHEHLACEQTFCLAPLDDPRIIIHHEGARSRDPDTYARDAAALEEALRVDPGNTRNVFYLAQSYRDCGQLAHSREVYLRRAIMGGWDEEVWYSLYQAALLTERLQESPADVSFGFLRAFQCRPSRAEPLVELARFHRLRGEFALAYLYAREAAGIPRPSDRLFLDDHTYEWRSLDELSISAFYVGKYAEGLDAADRLLSARVPDADRLRMKRNREFYINNRC
jgi:glycosyltransferase involved in cell wall biosynthesis